MSDVVTGNWHLMKSRCDKCGRLVDRLLFVSSGPTTGNFCSRFCYQAARDHMEQIKKEQLKENPGQE